MRRSTQRVLVHDASFGLGNACAAYLAKRGERVRGAMAHPDFYQPKSDEFFSPLRLDLRERQGPEEALAAMLAEEGRLDALILCPYRELSGALEDCGEGQLEEELRLEFTAQATLLRAALGAMRHQGRGKALIVLDAEAVFGIPYHAMSAAAQAALRSLALSARLELLDRGVEVCVVEAACIRSALSARRAAAAGWTTESPYHEAAEYATAVRERQARFGADPAILARRVLSLLRGGPLPPLVRVGSLRQRFPLGTFSARAGSILERGSIAYYGSTRRRGLEGERGGKA